MTTEWVHSLTSITIEKEFSGDTLASLYFQNDKKSAALHSQSPTEVQELAKSGTFVAAPKSCFFIRGSYIDEINLIFAGLGSKTGFSAERARQTGAIVWNKLQAEKVKHFGLDVDALLKNASKSVATEIIQAFFEGLYLSSYQFDKYKATAGKGFKLDGVSFVSNDKKNDAWLKKIANDVLITVDCTFITRDYSNEPSNFGTPEYFANDISKLAKRFGLKCKVLGEAEAKKEKMDLFLAVGAGSEREAKVVILEYTPKKASKSAKNIALVGKGVTFDSGGISIKPSLMMENMKHDMTGAATLLGSTLLAARLESKNRMTTILAFTENMPSGNAVQPGNVIRARNGKTVEIINTDAEGRLVLADALDLAHDYKPDVIVNAATLTGAVSVALGKYCSALFSNDPKLTTQMMKTAEATEEALWELPMWDEYFEDLKSTSADMRNSANDGNGGTFRGAVFMKQFIRAGMKWAHVDLANRAYDQSMFPYNPARGASGTYVRTFAHFVMNY